MKSLNIDRRVGLTCLLLAFASFLLHARTIGFEFVDFDDVTILLGHPSLYNENSFSRSLFEIFVGYLPREEPLLLRDVTWALDARLFGFENPIGYHLGNVLLNAANACLLFLFLKRTTGRHDFALVVAAIFATLPIHVEPVSWIMGRKDLLSAFFILSALLAQTAELTNQNKRTRIWLYALGLCFMTLALFSKMGAIALVPVLALHQIFLPDLNGTRIFGDSPYRLKPLRHTAQRLLPHALITSAIVVWYSGIMNEYGVTGWRGLGPTDPEHLWNVARFTPLVIGKYLSQTFWISQPSLYYRWPHVEIPLTGLEILSSALIAISVGAAILYCLTRRRDLAFYLLAFFAFLVPYLNIVYVGIWRADRYIYLSSFCLVALVVSLLLPLYRKAEGSRRFAFLALAVGFGLSSILYTLQHQSVWRDSESLWRYEAARDEPSLLSIQSLANLHMTRALVETHPPLRAAMLTASRQAISKGFEREKELGRVSAPYATSEQLQLSQLHYLLGRIEMIEQGPIASRIEHFQLSHALAPTRSNSLMLASAFFDLGHQQTDDEQEKLIHRSLDYFQEYMEFSAPDHFLREESLGMLTKNYEQNFAFLQARISEIRKTMTP